MRLASPDGIMGVREYCYQPRTEAPPAAGSALKQAGWSANDLPVGLDDETVVCLYELLANLLLDVNVASPSGNFGFVSDPNQPVDVLGATGTQHALSSQNDYVDPTLLRPVRASLRLERP
jgi:hypothetical protein